MSTNLDALLTTGAGLDERPEGLGILHAVAPVYLGFEAVAVP